MFFFHALFVFSPKHATCPAQLLILELIARIIIGEECGSWSCCLCNFLISPVASSLLKPNIFLCPTPRTCSSLNVRDKISYPYERTGEVTDRCILIVNVTEYSYLIMIRSGFLRPLERQRRHCFQLHVRGLVPRSSRLQWLLQLQLQPGGHKRDVPLERTLRPAVWGLRTGGLH